MRRRQVLAALGAATFVPTAGCVADTSRTGDESTRTDESTHTDGNTLTDETDTPTPTDSGPRRLAPGASTTVAGGVSLTIADPRVRRSVVTRQSSFFAVRRESGVQFVVVDVAGDTNFEPSSFVLERDGTIQSPPQVQQSVRSTTRSCSGTCIGIPVDAEAAASAAVAYRPDGVVRGVWELDDSTVAAFPRVPDVRLRDAVVTDESGDVGVELTVDNVGERDGVFSGVVAPAWLNDAGEPVGFGIPRNETVVETVVPSGIQQLDPDSAGLSTTPAPDTRYFEIGPDP